MLRIKLVKSPIGNNPRNRATVQALGLRKISQVVEKEDTPSIRGMIHAVKHMLVVDVIGDGAPVVDSRAPGSSSRMPRQKTPSQKHRHGEQSNS
jgi:large subunit ribosomal protein L30